jgi:hypothetical protein
MLRLILTVAIAPLEVVAPQVPPDIAGVVMQMLVRQREDRLRDLSALHQTLEKHCSIRCSPFGPPAQSTA